MNKKNQDKELFNITEVIKDGLIDKEKGIYSIIVRNFQNEIAELGPKFFAKRLEKELSLQPGIIKIGSLYSALSRYKPVKKPTISLVQDVPQDQNEGDNKDSLGFS